VSGCRIASFSSCDVREASVNELLGPYIGFTATCTVWFARERRHRQSDFDRPPSPLGIGMEREENHSR